ncbi:MAG TPA: class I SAM-dependent methyltransferase [Arachnia sp.]|nr:class I SAM-dependent methyltransferase [Arachnia sp.]HMT84814.1 class I SAM-dependent methyltransferase [Arachnia sp.]
MFGSQLPEGVVIETQPGLDPGARYDGRAAGYDWLIGREFYNRLAWSTSPRDYAAFAQRAVDSAHGPLLDVAAGTATATAEAYRRSSRPITVTDRSRDMLARAARRIAGRDRVRPGIRFLQADAFDLPKEVDGFDTVVCFGFLHLVDDVAGFLDSLRARLRPGGTLFCSSLVMATPRGTRYLRLLHGAGEVAAPRTADDLARLTGQTWRRRGSMAYLEFTA